MKRLLLFSLALFVAVGTAPAQTAPKSTAKTKAKTAKPMPPAKAALALTFERTMCLGTCPSYTARVFADGRVAYEGRYQVPVLGKKEFRLSKAVVTEALRMAQEAHFDTLKPMYSSGVTDVPSTLVGVRLAGGQLKTVQVEDNAPEELQSLIAYLRGQLDPLAGLPDGR